MGGKWETDDHPSGSEHALGHLSREDLIIDVERVLAAAGVVVGLPLSAHFGRPGSLE